MELSDYDFYEISPKRARGIGPFGGDDGPVTVTCYRQTEQWKSRKAAKAFYSAGANCCGGSEQGRYLEIVSQIESGLDAVDDGCS